MALPEYFKLHIVNDTGATIEFSTDGANNSFVITAAPWKWVDGVLTFGDEVTLFADPSSDLADGASLEGSEYDNSSNVWEGMFCRATLLTDAAVDGNINVYMEWSTDGSASGTYPSDDADTDASTYGSDLSLVAPIACDSTDDDRGKNFEI